MSLQFYTREDLKKHTSTRKGEEKFGQAVGLVNSWQALEKSDATYVLLGIAEDVGIRANMGRSGAEKAWSSCLSALCNIQSNTYTNPSNTVILGEIDCKAEQQSACKLDIKDPNYQSKIGSLVQQIDIKVSRVIAKVISVNKIPVIIGGGHNNSYGNIKGAATALKAGINCINLDPHTDFRALEHRHSGNGFSYAMEEGYLEKYYILGLHKNYTSGAVFEKMEAMKEKIQYSFFEDYITGTPFKQMLGQAKDFCANSPFGLELDMDAIKQMGSSAISPSGFSLQQTREYVSYFSRLKNCKYIHICEGAPERELHYNQVAKAISYLVSDVISKA
ncbi:formimidoylglutamase [Flavobacteriaceae bacterium]|nr:formimidoylglutamase [Flavobacteriaceae bacterium]